MEKVVKLLVGRGQAPPLQKNLHYLIGIVLMRIAEAE
jgi:hypothetical protein